MGAGGHAAVFLVDAISLYLVCILLNYSHGCVFGVVVK